MRSFWARKHERSYVGEFMALTINLRGILNLCVFGRVSYSLAGRGFKDFNIDLILPEMLLFYFITN